MDATNDGVDSSILFKVLTEGISKSFNSKHLFAWKNCDLPFPHLPENTIILQSAGDEYTKEHYNEINKYALIVTFEAHGDTFSGVTPKWLWDAYEGGATILRIRHYSKSLHNAFIRRQYLRKFEKEISLRPIVSGMVNIDLTARSGMVAALYKKAIRTYVDLAVRPDLTSQSSDRPLAILTAYNEQDIILEALTDLIDQGCDVIVIDNWSDDGTYESIKTLQTQFSDRILEVRRFPECPAERTSWADLVGLKEEIAAHFPGRWIISSDADEFRRSPLPGLNLAQALDCASQCGANRVNFVVLNYRPIDDGQPPEGHFRSYYRHFELPDHHSYFVQARAWLQPKQRVNLAATGGHIAEFPEAIDFPLLFLTKHIPIRSPVHAMRKIAGERAQRWSEVELKKGWHTHYAKKIAQSYIWISDTLYREDTSGFETDYGLILSTSLARFFSPVETGRAGEMRRWIDTPFLVDMNRRLSDITAEHDILRSWIDDLELRTGAPTHGLQTTLKFQINSLLISHISAASGLKRRWREPHRSYVERSIEKFFFSNNWYLNQYPDVAATGANPAKHYLTFGAKEGRDPTSYFSTLQYLLDNPDVAASGVNPLVHFFLHGAKEGRIGVHRVI
ncbi:glycosyltransferase [Methylobacterium sp. J-076]|uniref:glycosyltransferase n=1 Tax=Methylobacterium sp. J-076 TaxID=2836655 RepID=UPI001FBB3B2E|nr:glycosyltransferase [Methylobacterium sp. J-076]MCJ2011570.1 glycosyltransferase [Methylobacterium sp. J-076]